MDVASLVYELLGLFARSKLTFLRAVKTGIFIAFFLWIPATSQGQTRTIQVAVEPRFDNSSLVGLIKDAQPPELVEPARLRAVEPERMPALEKKDVGRPEALDRKSDPKKQTNFLPTQRPISQISIDLRSKSKNGNSKVPENLAEKEMEHFPAVHAATSEEMFVNMVVEKPRNHDELFAYQPLYFEEANLERYGRTYGCLQPALSGARFFATIPSLPYAMTAQNPRKTYFTQWPYEAGWGAPKVKELRPLQVKPSLVQAGAVTGLLFVLP